MNKRLNLFAAFKAVLMVAIWSVVLYMLFCESDTAPFEDLVMVKAIGVGMAYVLLKWMKIL